MKFVFALSRTRISPLKVTKNQYLHEEKMITKSEMQCFTISIVSAFDIWYEILLFKYLKNILLYKAQN